MHQFWPQPRCTAPLLNNCFCLLLPNHALLLQQPAPKKKAAADVYDYEDEWIDDTELIEYFGGDQRRAKHKGFFINKGDIEREDGPPKASPVARKRRRKEPEPQRGGGSASPEGGPADGPPAVQRKVCGGVGEC